MVLKPPHPRLQTVILAVAVLAAAPAAAVVAPTENTGRIAGPSVVLAEEPCGPGWYKTSKGTCRRIMRQPVVPPRWKDPLGDDGLPERPVRPRPPYQRSVPDELPGPPPPHLRWSPPPPPPRWQDMRRPVPRVQSE
ncbi:exported protein of unknown function [Pseudorhizobium banfieldiae]|uniref:Uncharacterized protein n=1 Tax=Pseudorhizobium banfieldiae TaxID=1125847 RepID=L0NEI0_9HYPH|nr:exported protein of unknown function [Pseudorhizobium banfieldiae]